MLSCLVGYKKGNYKHIKNIKGLSQKYKLALSKIISTFRFNCDRKIFMKYLTKKKIANKIYGWAVSRWRVRKHKYLIK